MPFKWQTSLTKWYFRPPVWAVAFAIVMVRVTLTLFMQNREPDKVANAFGRRQLIVLVQIDLQLA